MQSVACPAAYESPSATYRSSRACGSFHALADAGAAVPRVNPTAASVARATVTKRERDLLKRMARSLRPTPPGDNQPNDTADNMTTVGLPSFATASAGANEFVIPFGIRVVAKT